MVFETDSPRLPLSGATVFPLHIGGALPSCPYFETVSLAKSHFASLSEARIRWHRLSSLCSIWGKAWKGCTTKNEIFGRFAPSEWQKGDFFKALNFDLISLSIVLSLLEISCSLPYSNGIRQPSAFRLSRLSEMRHKTAPSWHKLGVKAGPRRRLRGVKWGISVTFARHAAEIFFRRGAILPPRALIWGKTWGKKAGQSEKAWNISNL